MFGMMKFQCSILIIPNSEIYYALWLKFLWTYSKGFNHIDNITIFMTNERLLFHLYQSTMFLLIEIKINIWRSFLGTHSGVELNIPILNNIKMDDWSSRSTRSRRDIHSVYSILEWRRIFKLQIPIRDEDQIVIYFNTQEIWEKEIPVIIFEILHKNIYSKDLPCFTVKKSNI